MRSATSALGRASALDWLRPGGVRFGFPFWNILRPPPSLSRLKPANHLIFIVHEGTDVSCVLHSPCSSNGILSAGGVADEWVVQLLRQGNSEVFKKYSQMKLAMKREALEQINRRADEMTIDEAPAAPVYGGFGTVMTERRRNGFRRARKCFRMKITPTVGV
jgi:hypothetical protein